MNKIKQFTKTTAGKVLTVLILLAIGFLGGMEYKAYQIRKALADAFKDFPGNTSITKKDEAEQKEVSNDLNKKIGFEITKKTFVNRDYVAEQNFTFKITNNTDKDITGIQGTVVMNDLFDNNIKSTMLTYDEGIKAGESKLYTATMDYNQFMESDIKLKGTELEKLKYEFDVDTIIYTDGTKESI